jgi:catechol 2,3-dioxygenase-like lactoylglutathione lyase family enzyme
MASPLKYDGGLTCALEVTNLDKSIDWYQGVLGFKLLYKMDEMGWCELATEIPKVNVGLGLCRGEKKTGGGTVLTFGVVDIEKARTQLESKNVRFEGPTCTIQGMVKLATFYDPDGNPLMFYQDLPKQA